MENIKNYTFLVRAFAEAIKKSYTEAFNEENNNIDGFAAWVVQYNRFGVAFHSSSGLGFGPINIFMPHVACILYANNIVFWCPNEQRNIDAIEVQETFREAYFDGYKKGLEYFKTEYKQLLFNAKDELLNELKGFYFENGAKSGLCGWNYVKQEVPIQFDLGYLKDVGYYSALVSCVDDLSEKHPVIFKEFYLNEATEPPPATEQKGYKLGYTDTELKAIFDGLKKQGFLIQTTKETDFVNAFSGSELVNFIPLEWRTPTECAVFFGYFLGELKSKKRIPWKQLTHLVHDKSANYKQLLTQSIKFGGYIHIKETLQKIKF